MQSRGQERERDETSWKEHGGVEGNGGIREGFWKNGDSWEKLRV